MVHQKHQKACSYYKKEERAQTETRQDSMCLQILRSNCQSHLSLQTSIRKIAIFMLSHWNLKAYKKKGKQLHDVNSNKWITGFS
jgi:hypothetical protein